MDATASISAMQGLLPASSAQPLDTTQAPSMLTSRFEQMMQQTPTSPGMSGGVDAIASPLVTSLINRVEQHISGHAQVIERAESIDPSSISAAELDTIQIKTVVQMGVLSMNQSAFFEVLGSTKSAVSSLMKNQ